MDLRTPARLSLAGFLGSVVLAVVAIAACGSFTSDGEEPTLTPDGGPLLDGSSRPGPSDSGPGGATGGDAADASEAGLGLGCPDAGLRYNGRCYFILPKLETQGGAQSACVAQNANLASFTDATEWAQAGGLYPSNEWIGLRYLGGQWMWPATNEPMTFFLNGPLFDGGAPPPGSDCVWDSQHHEWAPTPCSSSSAGAFCERPL